MSGGRALLSFMRRRSTCWSLYICALGQKGICVLPDWAPHDCISSHGKRVVPRFFCDRAAEYHFCLPHIRLYSLCSERLTIYDEGLEACVHSQRDVQETCGDLPTKHEDNAMSSCKSKSSRHSKCMGAMEGSKSSMLQHSKSQEGLQLRSFENGDSGSLVKVLDGEGNEAAHSFLRERDHVPGTVHLAEKEVRERSRLKAKRKQSGLQKHDRDALAKVFRHFREENWAKEQVFNRFHISAVVFRKFASHFRKFFFSSCTPDLKDHLLQLGPSAESDRFLFPLFWEFSKREFAEEVATYRALAQTADLTKPHTWFPFARAMKRKVIYHFGPTNSGKTYNALQRFKVASSGVYCGPLRLLAMEVYDSVNIDGVYCSLITGQEKKEVPFANHIACTVEMVSTTKPWKVAILDEIQLITDEYRGWAWTRAFLGVQAEEIHVCGDPSALKLVRDLCAVTGDELEEHSYERFEPLSINQQSLEGRYSKVQPGDCIVTFSRKEIFSIKRAVELFTKNRCCVIYGALPPETRTHQAKLFNDPDSGYNVLVATDAVGMGLNLNIRRVIFHTFEKYTGQEVKKVSASQVKQIAGRAGRRGTQYHAGVATTFFSRDIPYLLQCMEEPFVEARSAGLFPGIEQIEVFASKLPGATFSNLLDQFAESCQVDGSFFLCSCEHLKRVASVIDKVQELTLEDKMSFIMAPVNSRDAKVVGALLSFALAYSRRIPVHLTPGAPAGLARSVLQLTDLEARHQVLSLYLWLSQHLPEEYFPQREQAEQMAADIALIMGETLTQTNIRTTQEDPYSAKKKVHRNGRSPCARTRPAQRSY